MFKARIPLLIAVGLLVVGLAPWTFLTGQATPEQEEELKARVAALEREVREHRDLVQKQAGALKDLESRVGAAEAWFANVSSATTALESGVLAVEQHGFAYAGANPRARELLLATLRSLARDLKNQIPATAQTQGK